MRSGGHDSPDEKDSLPVYSPVPAVQTLTLARLSSVVPSNSLRSNGQDMKYRKLHSNVKKNHFHWEGIQTLI